MKPPQRSLKARALQWLAQREQSRSELRRKLLPHAEAEAEAEAEGESATEGHAGAPVAPRPGPVARVEAVLDWLEAHRYLSQERFIESRVNARASRYGNLRIRQELAQHRLALGAETARALRESELTRALGVLERKFGSPPAGLAERARQARFLAGRGFSPEVIARALRRDGAEQHATFDG